MKNFRTIIMLLVMISFAISSSAQSPAPGTTKEVKKENYKNDRNEKGDSEYKSLNYLEIKLKKVGKKIIVISDKSFFKPQDRESLLYLKREMLKDFFNLIENNHTDVSAELGKKGFKIISHSFAFINNNEEIHYYTIEL